MRAGLWIEKAGGQLGLGFGKLDAQHLGAALQEAGYRLDGAPGMRYRGAQGRRYGDAGQPQMAAQARLLLNHFLTSFPSCRSSVVMRSTQSPVESWTISRKRIFVSEILTIFP